MKRPVQTWQLDKARTAKALRELAPCEAFSCGKSGMGWNWEGLWLCPEHAKLRAQRPDAPRDS